jgi:hypothetical protein
MTYEYGTYLYGPEPYDPTYSIVGLRIDIVKPLEHLQGYSTLVLDTDPPKVTMKTNPDAEFTFGWITKISNDTQFSNDTQYRCVILKFHGKEGILIGEKITRGMKNKDQELYDKWVMYLKDNVLDLTDPYNTVYSKGGRRTRSKSKSKSKLRKSKSRKSKSKSKKTRSRV